MKIAPAVRVAKTYHLGSHRVCDPEQTWRRIQPCLSSFGITRVADVTALDRLGVPVFQAVRPLSRNISVSQGKAPTAMAARVSAVMEAIELWHAEDLGHLPQVELAVREMRSANRLAMEQLPWLPQAVRLEGWPFAWVEATSLATGEAIWLPRATIELDFSIHPRLEPRLFHRTSNGLASGNCLEEALVHALCEVIERHGLHLVMDPQRHRHAMDESTVDSPACRCLIDQILHAGARLALYNLTWEVGVPVIAAEICLPDLPRIFRGSGCHLAPEVAVSRALTEAVQSRLTVISGARDDLDQPPGVGGPSGWPHEPPHEVFDDFKVPEPQTSFGELVDVSAKDLAQDVELLVQRLMGLGIEPFVVDLTREDVGIPVVRVIAPGLGEAHD